MLCGIAYFYLYLYRFNERLVTKIIKLELWYFESRIKNSNHHDLASTPGSTSLVAWSCPWCAWAFITCFLFANPNMSVQSIELEISSLWGPKYLQINMWNCVSFSWHGNVQLIDSWARGKFALTPAQVFLYAILSFDH